MSISLKSIPNQRFSDGQLAYCLSPDRTLFGIPYVGGALDVRRPVPVDMDQPLARFMRAALLTKALQDAGDEASLIELELLAKGVEVDSSLSELDGQGPPLFDILSGLQLDEDPAKMDAEVLRLAERLAGLLSAA